MSNEILKVDGISTFYGNIQALKDVSLTVNRGEIVPSSAPTARAIDADDVGLGYTETALWAAFSSKAAISPGYRHTRSPAFAFHSRPKAAASSSA